MAKGRIIARTGIKKKRGYLRFLDAEGNVRESQMTWHRNREEDRDRNISSALDGTRKRRKKATTKKRTTTKKKSGGLRGLFGF
jgi:hypothetical protein